MFWEIVYLIIAITLFSFWRNSRTRRNLPPGPGPIFPILGNIPQLLKYDSDGSYESLNKISKDYGPLVFLQFGELKQVIVNDLDLAKELLSSDAWVDRFWDHVIAERSFGKNLGIIFAYGETWKEMRRFTMRTLRDFGFGKNHSMEGVIDEELSLLLQSLDKACDEGELSMKYVFNVSVLNILWSMMAGFRFSHDDVRLKNLIKFVDETSRNNPVKPSIANALPWTWHLIKNGEIHKRRRVFVSEMHKFFRETINERRQTQSYLEDPSDFVDVFLREIHNNDSKGNLKYLYTDEQFIIVSYDLFVAGADTTSNTLEFAILYMILNPEVQKKVQEEIDRVVGASRRPNYADRAKMPYTEATILEIQRCANVLPVVGRGAAHDTEISGFSIPKGTVLAISSHGLHYDKKTWGDPKHFRPERFLDKEKNIVNANKIIPFGWGKRVCLGETLARVSLFTYFTSFLQRYTVKSSPHRETPSTKPFNGFTLSPKEYYVVLERR